MGEATKGKRASEQKGTQKVFWGLNTNKERPRPKDRVLIHKKVDGEIKILWKNKPLKIREIIVEELGNPEPLTA